MLLKPNPLIYKLESYSLVKPINRAEHLIQDQQSTSVLNFFTQALYRTAKRLDIPFVTANMIGEPFYVVSLQSYGLVSRQSRALINPQLVWCSDESQEVEETFIYSPDESVIKIRPQKIKVRYMNRHKQYKVHEFSGRFAAYVLQAIEVLYGVPLTFIPPTPSEVAARLKAKYGDQYS